MSDCCCASDRIESERIPTGWQCPCCLVVYAPDVRECYCCIEDEIAEAPPILPGPPASSNPWFFTFQPPLAYSAVSVTVVARPPVEEHDAVG